MPQTAAHSPCPVAVFATSKACARILGPSIRSATAMRRLDPDFIPHEISFVIPGNAFFCSLPTVKLLNRYPDISTTRATQTSKEKSYHEAISNSKNKRAMSAMAPLLRTKDALELDSVNVAYLSKAILQVLRASMLREATNIHLVLLSGAEFQYRGQTNQGGGDNDEESRGTAHTPA